MTHPDTKPKPRWLSNFTVRYIVEDRQQRWSETQTFDNYCTFLDFLHEQVTVKGKYLTITNVVGRGMPGETS